ncbi:hypothetical protein AX16_010718 [Volvariella volvacea WC 439]|nr:hypothetical protein AX16_010718 [Volvariella volvacea WC 439]
MATLRVPVELVERIVGFIGDSNDKQTLNSCALASRQLLPITRFYKYSSISIVCDLNIVSLQKFASLLQDYPFVASYVQTFSISNDYMCVYPGNSPWMVMDSGRDLPSILNNLTSLKSLSLCARQLQSYSDLSDSLKQSLVSTLHLPTLRSLDLEGFQRIPGILFSSITIKTLRLSRCTINTPSLAQIRTLSNTPQSNRSNCIEDLLLMGTSYPRESLADNLDFFVSPNSPFNLASLRNLKVQTADGSESKRVEKLLDLCRKSLETFEFSVLNYSVSGSFNHISLNNLTSLKHLTLRTRVPDSMTLERLSAEDRLFPGPIIPITSMLLTLPGLSLSHPLTYASQSTPACALELLSIGFINYFQSAKVPRIDANTPLETVQSINIKTRAWKRLDNVLTALIAASRNGSCVDTGADEDIVDDYQSDSDPRLEPVVKIYCLEGIGLRHLTRQSLKNSFKTGRVKVIFEN